MKVKGRCTRQDTISGRDLATRVDNGQGEDEEAMDEKACPSFLLFGPAG